VTEPPLGYFKLLAYGGLGLPLAFAALPLFVHIVPFYSAYMSLALLGVVLLGLRVFDAVIDPVIGQLFDRFPHPRVLIALALPLLGIGWVALFHPPVGGPVVPWLIATLLLTTLGYSLATVVHTSWGARLHPDPHQRTRAFAAREGAGLIGVVIAAALPLWLAATLAPGLQKNGLDFHSAAGDSGRLDADRRARPARCRAENPAAPPAAAICESGVRALCAGLFAERRRGGLARHAGDLFHRRRLASARLQRACFWGCISSAAQRVCRSGSRSRAASARSTPGCCRCCSPC
jgi:Na+/melibiose symporter and related transporters